MPDPDERRAEVETITARPCECQGQCGTLHTGHTATCWKQPSFTVRHVAAPADPCAPVTVGAQLLSWCPTCYNAARRRGHAARRPAEPDALF